MAYSHVPWPHYDEETVEAVAYVLRSGKVNYWTGTEGREFEKEFAEFTGVDHAILVANGTVALELALRALALPPGSEVITTPRTFIASSSAVVACGLTPVLVDVDPDSGNITPESAEGAITDRTSAILVVHLGGWPADMPGFRALCDDKGLALVEDCSQAHGAMICDSHVGTFGDISAWSFCQDKIITTGGEGGMVATNNESWWRWMWSYKDHGKSWEAVYERDHPPGFRWLHESFGTNWRATEMQAAIGRIQYRRLPQWREDRAANAEALTKLLADTPGLRVPLPGDEHTPAYYRLYAYVDPNKLADGWSRDRIIAEVTSRFDVPVFSGSCSEIYREKAFAGSGLELAAPLPVARTMSDTALAFLVHTGLSGEDMETVAVAVSTVMSQAFAQDAAGVQGEESS